VLKMHCGWEALVNVSGRVIVCDIGEHARGYLLFER
jgi:hypothetical protein